MVVQITKGKKKHTHIALSSIENEYIATNEASKKMTWLYRFVQEFGAKHKVSMP